MLTMSRKPILGKAGYVLVIIKDEQGKTVDFWQSPADYARRLATNEDFYESSPYKTRINTLIRKMSDKSMNAVVQGA